ncbi:MAG: 2-hydroxyacyl-CoA dehydratase [Chloroflexi bacterium]|nr:2-hydroxyacyl-CoA dehydratase [Chloroflexota bacterium]
MATELKTLEEMRSLIPQGLPPPEERRGRKVIGWLCTYVPEEIIYAAGMFPLRVRGGSGEIQEASAYLHANTCSFSRSCLERALDGTYRLLDGVVSTTSCDPKRRLYDYWKRYLPIGYIHLVHLPHAVSAASQEFYRSEIARFQETLEEFGGERIAEEAIREAIRVYNRSRDLLQQLYELRKQEPPALRGSEALEIVTASYALDRRTYNTFLERLLDEARQRSPGDPEEQERPVRLLLAGSILNNSDFLRGIELLGAEVVCEDLCSGSRYFLQRVDELLPPLEGLAQRYLTRPSCARMQRTDHRFEHLLRMVADFHADGVVYESIKFCSSYGQDRALVKKRLAQAGIPLLELEVEYAQGFSGALRTRLEAFLEILKGGRSWRP